MPNKWVEFVDGWLVFASAKPVAEANAQDWLRKMLIGSTKSEANRGKRSKLAKF
jgi:hypothetical protein